MALHQSLQILMILRKSCSFVVFISKTIGKSMGDEISEQEEEELK